MKELLYDLVSVQSDSFTDMEITMGDHIYDMIREQDYWQQHPELCGQYEGGDLLGRRVVWALRQGRTERTIVLAGHYDCVEIDCYGQLKPLALQPDKLRAEMLQRSYPQEVDVDLQNEDWQFGRGMADMKAGVAGNLYCLFQDINPEINILFVGIPDEEHQTSGMMMCSSLMGELKDQFGLDYKLMVMPEPSTRLRPNGFMLYDGSVGKMLPGIVARGRLCHVGNVMTGLNSTLMMANIIRRLELNIDFCCQEFGTVTTPPTTLYMKDNKTTAYTVSVPECTNMYIHIPLTKNQPVPIMYERLKALCAEAAQETLEAYNKAYRFIYGSDEGNPNFQIRVMTYGELEDICRGVMPDYEEKKAALLAEKTREVLNQESHIQTGAGFDIIEETIRWSKITDPMYVIGLLPPYVPAVNNRYYDGFDNDKYLNLMKDLLKEKYGLEMDINSYYPGLSDNSYICCTQIEVDVEAMSNMVTPPSLYEIPFEAISKVTLPGYLVGPWGKEYHTPTERVYMPDVENVTPDLIKLLIENI